MASHPPSHHRYCTLHRSCRHQDRIQLYFLTLDSGPSSLPGTKVWFYFILALARYVSFSLSFSVEGSRLDPSAYNMSTALSGTVYLGAPPVTERTAKLCKRLCPPY